MTKSGMHGFTMLSKKNKPLKELQYMNLHQEIPRRLTTVVETNEALGSIMKPSCSIRNWMTFQSNNQLF